MLTVLELVIASFKYVCCCVKYPYHEIELLENDIIYELSYVVFHSNAFGYCCDATILSIIMIVKSEYSDQKLL